MPAILPSFKIDSDALLAKYFMPHQANWIQAEQPLHDRKQRAFILAEKSIRIGWTFADAFKNVRKRLRFPRRDYLFVTKDYPSALEYMLQCRRFAEFLDFTRAIVSHGESSRKVHRLDPQGRPTAFTEDVKIGYIKFDNGSRIIAFSSNPHAMAVYGGDVGLDEFAKHPNAKLLWEVAQGRVTWAGDLAVWSAHDGQDTLFYEFARQARAATSSSSSSSSSSIPSTTPPLQESITPAINSQPSTLNSPWNLYYRVTMPDAIELGLLDVINRTQGTCFTPEQFLADCRARAGSEEIYQQSYLCNPMGDAANHIVDWSAIERCRSDYSIERAHVEDDQILDLFGEFSTATQHDRESKIHKFLRQKFPNLFQAVPLSHLMGEGSGVRGRSINPQLSTLNYRLGFDVAASGQGNLAAFYLDESNAETLWLRALLTARTEDWHFLKTVLFAFLKLPNIRAAGDESGLGRQICWEAAQHHPGRFLKVNFAAKKHDLGFALMNQLSVAQKRFPSSDQDIAADYFALRKAHNGNKWAFSEASNPANPASHCDIAWAGALATHAHTALASAIGAAVLLETGWLENGTFHPFPEYAAPFDPKMQYSMGCAFCRHRPNSFKPLLPRCEKCGLYLPQNVAPDPAPENH